MYMLLQPNLKFRLKIGFTPCSLPTTNMQGTGLDQNFKHSGSPNLEKAYERYFAAEKLLLNELKKHTTKTRKSELWKILKNI